jgi:hypothetical protein
MRLSRALYLLAFCWLAACATREVLEIKSATVPAGIDFSGHWRLRTDTPAERDQINTAIARAAGGNGDIIPLPPEGARNQPTQARPRPGKAGGGLVHVFLESGQHLKVTQTSHGIFISYDRSVVREFRFGENRTINVGEIVAQRVSGWVGDRYLVETLDRNGMKLTEELYLSADRQTLHRNISLRKADKSAVNLHQTFDRDGNLASKEGGEPLRDPAGK